ncbi:MAG: signal peptidase I [Oscillospiraceae bacterium]|nr:signal peptidase I [Oscillospiraceae bacterium]
MSELDKREIRKQESNPEEDKNALQKSIVMYLHDLVYLLAGVMLVLLLLFRVVVVSGPSMNATMVDGDYLLLVGNVFYGDPEYGDIVVASKESFKNGEPIIKRVIATEGQVVDIDFNAGVVYVDGIPLDEPYTNTPTNLEEGIQFPVTVKEGCVFVMGDNRNASNDSRNPEIGQIDCREILGKAVFLIFPGNNGGSIARDFSRIGVVS